MRAALRKQAHRACRDAAGRAELTDSCRLPLPAAACRVQGVPPIDASVSVVGPIAGTVADCALAYALLGNTGQLPGHAPPPVLLPALGGERSGSGRPLEGRKAGVYWRVRGRCAAVQLASSCERGQACMCTASVQLAHAHTPPSHHMTLPLPAVV